MSVKIIAIIIKLALNYYKSRYNSLVNISIQGLLMKSLPLFALLFSSTFLFATNHSAHNKELQNIVKQGNKGSKLLIKTLSSQMKKEMKNGGVMKALHFCSQEAYNLTQKVNKKLLRVTCK